MSLEVIKLENELMKSNCYVITDWSSKTCTIIDPASEKSTHEIEYIESNGLKLDYIILTHEHTDHTWGVNALKEKYPQSKLVCSEQCEKYAPKASRVYFLFYYDNPDYRYVIVPGDIIIKSNDDSIEWNGHIFQFVLTPGHSYGSMCIAMEGMLFTGDTIMPFKPYFNGRDSNEDDWNSSIDLIMSKYKGNTLIYPGHGALLSLEEWYVAKYK